MRACVYDFEPSLLKHLPDGPSCLCSIKTQKECETALDITIVINRDNNHGDGDGEDGDGTTVMVKTEVENYQQTMKLSSSASVSANCATSYTAERDLRIPYWRYTQVHSIRWHLLGGVLTTTADFPNRIGTTALLHPDNWSYLPAPELRSSSVQVHTSTPATQLIVASGPG